MNTCRAAAARQESLSQRVARATQLLSTRVDVTREKQNQAVLESMNRRAAAQLRLQQTVEGLSVAAITYYIVGLVGYAAKGAKAAGLAVSPDLAMAVSIPAGAAARDSWPAQGAQGRSRATRARRRTRRWPAQRSRAAPRAQGDRALPGARPSSAAARATRARLPRATTVPSCSPTTISSGTDEARQVALQCARGPSPPSSAACRPRARDCESVAP